MALADGISFNAASGGTGAFVYDTARSSFYTPAQGVSEGELVDGIEYSYLAQDSLTAPTQREWGVATFNAGASSFVRTIIRGGISNGMVSGPNVPVDFLVPPIISLTLLAEDVRLKLTQDTTFFVSNSGSDLNNGFTIGTAWMTSQHAADWLAANVDASGFSITVQFADGTYAGCTISATPINLGANYIWNGNASDNSLVVFNNGSYTAAVIELLGNIAGLISFQNFTIAPTVESSVGISSDYGNQVVEATNIAFDSSALTSGGACFGIDNAFCAMTSGVGNSVKGTWLGLVWIFVPAVFNFTGGPITLIGTPAFTLGTVQAYSAGAIIIGNGEGWVGSATGPRFVLQQGASIEGDGSGNLNYYPGNSAGQISSGGGFYDGILYSPAVQKSGLPTTSDIPSGYWAVFKDTSGGGVYVAYNDSGTIKKVALT